MKRIISTLCLSVVCSSLWANPVTGTISSITIETEESHFKRAGYVSLQISGAHTGPKCTFLYLSPKDKSAIGFSQEAFVHNVEVKVFYKEDVQAPWGIGACPIETIVASK